jgi:hypothetical protein
LREEHRLRISEDRVLRIFGPKREEDGSWRKLRNDEPHSLYSSRNKIRWVVHVAHMWVGRDVYRALVGSPKGKRPLGRLIHRWEDNIKMNLSEIGIDGASWIRLSG